MVLLLAVPSYFEPALPFPLSLCFSPQKFHLSRSVTVICGIGGGAETCFCTAEFADLSLHPCHLVL